MEPTAGAVPPGTPVPPGRPALPGKPLPPMRPVPPGTTMPAAAGSPAGNPVSGSRMPSGAVPSRAAPVGVPAAVPGGVLVLGSGVGGLGSFS